MIPFNQPYLTGNELNYIQKAHSLGQLAGDGFFTRTCQEWLEKNIKCTKALLTHSCTAALEMSAMLAGLVDGDEVIMPSYTFVSTANAFALRGAVPVFVDIRPDTMNLNEELIEDALTPNTKAIIPVHYGGISCNMGKILEIARKNNLIVIEDAAQGICSNYKNQPLGSIGQLGCLSFHETKNIHSGEGGALLINDDNLIERAEIIREKGTDRSRFFRGQIDKYNWIDLGSSYLPGELIAAFLFAQLENAEKITYERLSIWQRYHELFEELEKKGKVQRPAIHEDSTGNGHIYYLLLDNRYSRSKLIQDLSGKGINTVFHYQPLHLSPAGKRFGIARSPLPVTEDISNRLVRLPVWIGLQEQEKISHAIYELLP